MAGSIAFHHFGCKVNFAETSAISRQFRDHGYSVVDFLEPADIYVISTCAVTAVAEKKCRAAIRQAHRRNPNAKIAVIGCLPELNPGEITLMEGVRLVLGHDNKFTLLQELEKMDSVHSIAGIKSRSDKEVFISSYSYGDRTRSFLKIQDGCDYFCAYCAIPFARGHSRSDTIQNVLNNAREIRQAGVKEIVLTGVNIGNFGNRDNETLAGLLRELDRIPDLPRIRLSSIEPDLLTDEIITLVSASARFMPHFHIPLQSGSDRILKLMKRKYNTALYTSRISKIRSIMPTACIAADVITGFPGESNYDFKESVQYIEGLDISYLHVFSYSRREGTLASKMTGQVPERIRKARSEILHSISENKKKEFYFSQKGTEANVLFEADNSNGFMHGFSENYIKVKTRFDPRLINTITRVLLKEIDPDLCFRVEFPD